MLGSTIICSCKVLGCDNVFSQEQRCAERHIKASRVIHCNAVNLTDPEGNLCTGETIVIDC